MDTFIHEELIQGFTLSKHVTLQFKQNMWAYNTYVRCEYVCLLIS